MEQEEKTGEIVLAGWHLKKEITIAQIITLVSLLFSTLWWASSVETRLIHLSGEDKRIEQKQDTNSLNIEKILGRIERKQDKLFDKLDNKADKKRGE